MKRYIKDGEILYDNQITIVKTIETKQEVECPDEDGELTTKEVTTFSKVRVFNPSEAEILADGWSEYVPQTKRSYDPAETLSYDELVNYYIRERYSESAEFAILRQRDTKSDEWQAYYSYCEECKQRAKEAKQTK